MSEISIEGISKSFGATEVLHGIDLKIPDASFTVLLGPSGCGKSTLLRIIAGLEKPNCGEVKIGARDVTRLEPGDRDVAMVFQNYALYPHLSVYSNIEYGLKARKVKKPQRETLVKEALGMVRLEDQTKKLPAQMSGGQRQRVALARAIVKRPEVFLMDEPLSNLDAKLRGEMRFELTELYNKLGTTFLYVTHDQVEAMSMGTNIVILNKGVVQQQGTPREIYENPANVFVAGFIGSPPANLLESGPYTYAIRPEHVKLHAADEAYITVFGDILSSEHLGSETVYTVSTNLGHVNLRTPNEWNSERRSVKLCLTKANIMVFDNADGKRVVDEVVRRKAVSMLEGQTKQQFGANGTAI